MAQRLQAVAPKLSEEDFDRILMLIVELVEKEVECRQSTGPKPTLNLLVN